MQPKKFYTIPEAAKKIGLSRSQVFRKVIAGEIKAEKYGKVYLIDREIVESLTGKMSKEDVSRIELAVKRTLRDYGEVIKSLGDQ